MKLKIIVLFIGWMAGGFVSPDLAQVREDYRQAADSEDATKKLYDELTTVGKNDETVLVAYKGAITAKMADYAQGIRDKKNFFKEGKELLEYALKTEPGNVEIRCIRLSVQENVPKITGYFKNRDEDKQFILDNYASMKEGGAKAFVKAYASLSDSFTDGEKRLF